MRSSITRAWIVAVLALTVTAFAAADSQIMSVQVKEAAVRATPSFLGKIVADLPYGTRVTVVESRAGWAHIDLPAGGLGWLHSSALTAKRLALRAGGNVAQGASSSEVALAGKGFNEQVETQYRGETKLDYAWVDKMEKIVYSPAQLVAFLKKGDLVGSGEPAK